MAPWMMILILVTPTSSVSRTLPFASEAACMAAAKTITEHLSQAVNETRLPTMTIVHCVASGP
jgi:hypothetical protein